MEHPNGVIPTDQFFSRIWGYDTDAELGVVWVYISGLRKRLQAVGSAVGDQGKPGRGLPPGKQGGGAVIRRLQRKFICIVMLSLGLVILLLLGSINLLKYHNTAKRADEMLRYSLR